MIAYNGRVRAIPRLSRRLAAIAKLVPQCTTVADIGTDHALLPVWLVVTGRVRTAIAADIGRGPLVHARRTVARYGLEAAVTLRQANGLLAIRPSEVDCVVIAGMGPQRILEIIAGGPGVMARLGTLVVQPNHGGVQVRRKLVEIGWSLVDETLCEDRGHFYTAMLWRAGEGLQMHTNLGLTSYLGGDATRVHDPGLWTEAQWLFGPHIWARGGATLERFLAYETARALRVLEHTAGHEAAERQRTYVSWLRELHGLVTRSE